MNRIILCSATKIGLFAAFLFLLGNAVPARGQWIADDFSCPVSRREATDLFTLDSSHVWLSLNDHSRKKHYVIRTTDGGKSWISSTVEHPVGSLYFVSPKLGLALEFQETKPLVYDEYLVRSTDGGKSWRRLSSPLIAPAPTDGLQVVGLSFADAKNGWLVASAPSRVVVYHTSDAGRTIQKVSEIPGIGNCSGIYVSGRTDLWIYGQGFALHSRDEGRTWNNPLDFKKLHTNEYALSISAARFFRDGRGFLVGAFPMMLSTQDFGNDWHVAHDSDEGGSWSISFWNDKDGCVSGPSNHLTCTNDGGVTWNLRPSVLPLAQSQDCTAFEKLAILQSGRGWTVGNGGNVFETSDFGQTWRAFDLLSLAAK